MDRQLKIVHRYSPATYFKVEEVCKKTDNVYYGKMQINVVLK